MSDSYTEHPEDSEEDSQPKPTSPELLQEYDKGFTHNGRSIYYSDGE